jgi:PAS domain S-box-containing protein
MLKKQYSTGFELIFAKRELRAPFRLFDIECTDSQFCHYTMEEFTDVLFNLKLNLEDKRAIHQSLNSSIESKSSYSIFYSLQNAQNNWVSIIEKGIYNENDNCYNVILTEFPSIGNRKSDKYLKIFNEIREAVLLYRDNIIQDVNQAFCDIFGYEKSELIGKHITEALPSKEKDPKINEIQNLIKNNSAAEYEEIIRYYKKDGSEIFLSLKAGIIEIEKIKYRCLRITDISKDLAHKKKLLESNNKYKHLLNSSREGIVIHDKGIAVEVNKRFCEIVGRTEAEILGRSLTGLVVEEEVSRIVQFIKENEANFDIIRNEKTKIALKNGASTDIELWGNKIEIEGTPYRFVVIRDISEEINARKKIELNEKRYKLLSDITDEIIMVHDGGYIVEVNRAACDFFDFSEKEFIGKHTFDIMTEESIKELGLTKEMLNEVYRTSFEKSGMYKKNKNGIDFHFQYKEELMSVDGKRLRLVVMRDITPLRESQLLLEESRNKYKLFSDTTNEAISICKDCKALEVNKAYCDLFQLDPENISGYNVLENLLPKDREVFENFNRMLSKVISGIDTKDLKQESLRIHIIEKMHGLIAENTIVFPYELRENGSFVIPLKKRDGTIFMADYFDDYIIINGSIYQYQIIRDVTKSFESSRKLEESNRKYKFFADATNEGIIIHKDGEIIEVNEAACRLFMKTEVEFSGLNISDLIEKKNKSAKKLQNRNIRIFKKSSGENFIAEFWESSIEKDSLSYTVIRDITDRIRYEERIENLVFSLSERTKELNCLLDLSRLNSNFNQGTIEDLINKSLDIISSGWQFPEICGVSVNFSNKTYSNKVFKSNYSFIAAPINTGNMQSGSLKVFYTEDVESSDKSPFLDGEKSLIEALSLQLGMIIEKKQSEDLILATILETEDRERARLAKDVHDNLGQILMAVSLNLESVSRETNLLGNKNQNKLSNALHYLGQAIQESRELAHSLMPKAISDYGYTLAVQSLIEKLGAEHVEINFYHNLEKERLNAKIELALFRITQEALTNILKHSEAAEVTIQLIKHSDQLILTIEDNGKGFDYNQQQKYFGINSMRTRASAISGIFTVDTKLGGGTTLMIEIPL